MMTYPNSYALLSEEELEYTTGGALDAETVGNWISTAMNVTMGVLAIVNVVNAIKKGQISSVLASVLGTGAGLLAYVNIANIGSVAAQVQKQYPEQYPEEEGTINGNLIIDSTLTYFSSVAGIGMGLLNIAAGVGTVYLGMKSGS
jgi:hypothetical protein